jgi:hypothetical protein
MKRFLIQSTQTTKPFRYESNSLNLAEMYRAIGFYVYDQHLRHELRVVRGVAC